MIFEGNVKINKLIFFFHTFPQPCYICTHAFIILSYIPYLQYTYIYEDPLKHITFPSQSHVCLKTNTHTWRQRQYYLLSLSLHGVVACFTKPIVVMLLIFTYSATACNKIYSNTTKSSFYGKVYPLLWMNVPSSEPLKCIADHTFSRILYRADVNRCLRQMNHDKIVCVLVTNLIW